MKKRLVVGLGNPGKTYQDTRHNLGFMILDAFANKYQLSFKSDKRFFGQVAKGKAQGNELYLLKPMTYMNHSGKSVEALFSYYKFDKHEMLIVLDDISFPFTTLKLRKTGSAGGHNGLKDILQMLKKQKDIPRLRVGIGEPSVLHSVTQHVLEKFTPGEKIHLPELLHASIEAIDIWLTCGEIEQSMNKINK